MYTNSLSERSDEINSMEGFGAILVDILLFRRKFNLSVEFRLI